MTVALLVITDGREDYLERTLASAQECLPAVDHQVLVDDSAHELGFAGAIQHGWQQILDTDADYCLHLEADFVFNRPVDIAAMIDVLAAHPHLVQMALLRQPWNRDERRAGGIIQQHPASYQQVFWRGQRWLEHCRFVTTNPCVWPRWVLERGWPQRPQSEGIFGLELFAEDPRRRAAFWGAGEEWVTHIGAVRAGVGY